MRHVFRLSVLAAFFSLFLCLFVAPEVLARTPPKVPGTRHDSGFETQMRAAAQGPVRELLQQGKSQLGDIRLEALVKDLEKVRWEVFLSGFLAGSGEQRASSVYWVEKRKVIFNSMSLQYIPKSLIPHIALHESLGALGYEDEDYQLTLGILLHDGRIQSRLKISDADLLPIFSGLKIRTSTPVYLAQSGGSTSVGGGGDGPALDVKLTTLIVSRSWFEHYSHRSVANYPQLLRNLLLWSFESSFEGMPTQDFRIESKKGRRLVRVSLVNWLSAGMRGDAEKIRIALDILEQIQGETP